MWNYSTQQQLPIQSQPHRGQCSLHLSRWEAKTLHIPYREAIGWGRLHAINPHPHLLHSNLSMEASFGLPGDGCSFPLQRKQGNCNWWMTKWNLYRKCKTLHLLISEKLEVISENLALGRQLLIINFYQYILFHSCKIKNQF